MWKTLLWLSHGRNLVSHPGRRSQLLCSQDAFDVGLFFSLLPLAASFAAGTGRGRDTAAWCQALEQGITPGLCLVPCQGDWAGTRGLPEGLGFLLAPRKHPSPGPCCCVVHPALAGQLQNNLTVMALHSCPGSASPANPEQLGCKGSCGLQWH